MLDNHDIKNDFEYLRNKDLYDSLDNKEEFEFKLLKKAYKNFGGSGFKKPINKKTGKFINIKKIFSATLRDKR